MLLNQGCISTFVAGQSSSSTTSVAQDHPAAAAGDKIADQLIEQLEPASQQTAEAETSKLKAIESEWQPDVAEEQLSASGDFK